MFGKETPAPLKKECISYKITHREQLFFYLPNELPEIWYATK